MAAKKRRLRSMLRQERQTVAVALAESQHHSAQRPKMARAGEWGSELHVLQTATFRKTSTHQPELFELSFDEEPGGSRQPCLGEPRRPQAGVLRHVVEHMADVCPFVQVFDAPLPQVENQLLQVFRHRDCALPEQAAQDLTSQQQRLVDRDLRHPQMAEQLVEVPTVFSPSLLRQLSAEQIVDIPVRVVVEVRAVEVFNLQGFRHSRTGFNSFILISWRHG